MRVCTINADTLKIEEKNISGNLESLQREVGGLIEAFDFIPELVNKDISLYLNEEGKLLGLKPSVAVADNVGRLVEILCGNIVFVSFDMETGKSESLTSSQIAVIKKVFSRKAKIMLRGKMFPVYHVKVDI